MGLDTPENIGEEIPSEDQAVAEGIREIFQTPFLGSKNRVRYNQLLHKINSIFRDYDHGILHSDRYNTGVPGFGQIFVEGDRFRIEYKVDGTIKKTTLPVEKRPMKRGLKRLVLETKPID